MILVPVMMKEMRFKEIDILNINIRKFARKREMGGRRIRRRKILVQKGRINMRRSSWISDGRMGVNNVG